MAGGASLPVIIINVMEETEYYKLKYTGRRRNQYVIGGRSYVLNPFDIIEVPYDVAVELLNGNKFKICDDKLSIKIRALKVPVEKNRKIQNMLLGKRCFIVGRGPSLTGFDFYKLKDEFTIAINGAFTAFNSSAVIFLDRLFVSKFKEQLAKYDGYIFGATRTDYHMMDLRDNVYHFQTHSANPQQSLDTGLYCGALSGIASINLAMVMGADKIYLLGFDMGEKTRGDYFDSEERNRNYTIKEWADARIKMFKRYMCFGDKIIDCTPDNVLPFPHENINDVLRRNI